MSDNLNIKGPADRNFINLGEDHEVRYWCARYGCTKLQLQAAVRAVGTSANAVRLHLGK